MLSKLSLQHHESLCPTSSPVCLHCAHAEHGKRDTFILHMLSVVFLIHIQWVFNCTVFFLLFSIFRGMMCLPVNALCFWFDHNDVEKYQASEFLVLKSGIFHSPSCTMCLWVHPESEYTADTPLHISASCPKYSSTSEGQTVQLLLLHACLGLSVSHAHHHLLLTLILFLYHIIVCCWFF